MVRRAVRLIPVLVVGALLSCLMASPAQAAPGVSVAGVGGKAQASADGPTTLKLKGSGFQSIKNGFGGIYVFFGTVSGAWKPSQGGVSGKNFLYVPDSQTKDNGGMEKFVAFPGSSTGDTANGGQIAAAGTWETTIVVPGPTFTAEDAAGKKVTVDCRKSQCGIITIGAHAVVNASNESFTPVSFGGGGTPAKDSGGAGADPSGAASAPAVPAGEVTIGVDATTAVAGHALSVVARGFEPGEQVVAVLDDGVVVVGPLTAGKYGEVAAGIQLDPELRVGTHVVKMTGASSGLEPQAQITVRRDPALLTKAEAAGVSKGASGDSQTLTPLEIAIVAAAAALAIVLLASLIGALARRKAAKTGGPKKPKGRPRRPAARRTRRPRRGTGPTRPTRVLPVAGEGE
jgi:hypothetical protein